MSQLIEKKQNNMQNALAIVTVMPAFLAVMNVVMYSLGLAGFTSYITALVYIVVLIYIILSCPLYSIDVLLLLIIYAVFLLNYFLFPSTRDRMTTQGMLILYFFFLPYCVFCFKNIRSWRVFWDRIGLYSLIAILLSAEMMIFLPYSEQLDYMEFSYAILPANCALIYTAYTLRRNKIIYFGASIISIVEMLAFGARAPAAYCLIYFMGLLVFTGFNSGSKKKIISIVLLLIGIVFILEINNILILVSRLSGFENSYIMRRFISGKLLNSQARELIWESCFERLENMGFYVGGFFGDRQYCISVYPHNIGIEILMSWGWVIGSLMLILILALIINSMRTRGVYRDVAWYFIMTFFARFILSGTYVAEGKFWISMFVLIAVVKSYKCRQNSLEM